MDRIMITKITLNKCALFSTNLEFHTIASMVFVREHGVHAGPKDYFVVVVVVVVVVICGSI
jgi:hypothetical protein